MKPVAELEEGVTVREGIIGPLCCPGSLNSVGSQEIQAAGGWGHPPDELGGSNYSDGPGQWVKHSSCTILLNPPLSLK